MKQTLVVSATNDERGYSKREISLDDDGTLIIEGHDIGSGVSNFFGDGNNEYEFFRTVRAPGVAKLKDTIGAGDDTLLDDLRHRFPMTSALEAFLAEQGIESEFWSRAGD